MESTNKMFDEALNMKTRPAIEMGAAILYYQIFT